MCVLKKYLSRQFQVDKLTLQHDDASEFYLSCLQQNRSPVPLLCIRLILFLTCVGILVMSLLVDHTAFWIIYMTNWGVVIITVTTGLAFAVSTRAFLRGPIDSTFGLPWYLKLYWASYNIGLTAAFLITVFYYSFLYELVLESEMESNPITDLLTHGINSVVMFLLLITSMQPSHVLHCVYPIAVLTVYSIFNVIYYYAGGENHLGDRFIYPMLDWSNPGLATGVLFGCLAGVIILHVVIVLVSLLRDYLSKRYVRNIYSLSITA
ncbi:unnamed protein product [Diatraea saccharalis]|uniref:Protein rolling stone-like n=1 Tax=Diatraea saccharalis TaxID=40085 RepID=A0A9N9RGD9_9NEOP|nr:unnamed protein product [Diatraea saccharalis]